jgi:hypothetical protein
VTGPLAQRRQPRRRRITPNTNTSTTTMISTHNHVDMAASLVGAGAIRGDATAAHPSKQLGHRQATSRARIDGRAPRRLAETPAPRDLPADLGWSGSRPRVSPGRAEPFGPRPASPAQPPHPAPHERRIQHHTRGGPDRRQPTRRDHSDPDRRVWRGRERLLCLGGGTMQAWLRRDAMADAAPPAPDRWCAPSAKPELAPRTAAPPSFPGTTPLDAARSTKAGTDRRSHGRGDATPELPGPMVSRQLLRSIGCFQHSTGTWDNLFRGAALGVEAEGPCDGNKCRRQG